MKLAPVGLRARLADQVVRLEATQDAGQIAGVDRQRLREVGCRDRGSGMGKLIERSNLGERIRAVVETLAQHADPLRVEAVETAHRVDMRVELGRHGSRRPATILGRSRPLL